MPHLYLYVPNNYPMLPGYIKDVRVAQDFGEGAPPSGHSAERRPMNSRATRPSWRHVQRIPPQIVPIEL